MILQPTKIVTNALFLMKSDLPYTTDTPHVTISYLQRECVTIRIYFVYSNICYQVYYNHDRRHIYVWREIDRQPPNRAFWCLVRLTRATRNREGTHVKSLFKIVYLDIKIVCLQLPYGGKINKVSLFLTSTLCHLLIF